MEPLGGTILSQDVISSYLSLLTSVTLAWILFLLNNGAFETFQLGASTIATVTFGIWSYGCGPRPNFFSYPTFKIRGGNDTLIEWGQLFIWFFLYCCHCWSQSSQVFGRKKIWGEYCQFCGTFELFQFNPPHFCLNSFCWRSSCSYSWQWLYVPTIIFVWVWVCGGGVKHFPNWG